MKKNFPDKSSKKDQAQFNGQMVMVAALTAAVVTVLLLSLWFYTFGLGGMMQMM